MLRIGYGLFFLQIQAMFVELTLLRKTKSQKPKNN